MIEFKKFSPNFSSIQLFAVFIAVMVYESMVLFIRNDLDFSIPFFLLIVLLSIVFFAIQSKLKNFYPMAVIAAIFVFSNFALQRMEFVIDYNIFYFLGFAMFCALLLNCIQREKFKEFWIILLLLVVATMLGQFFTQIPIGDEGTHINSLTLLEEGKILPESLGIHNYLNISPVYFYYIVIITKILGISLVDSFFLLKTIFTLAIFVSFVLLATQFSDKKLGLWAALLAFLPILNLHLAPQLLGRLLILNLFIYLYLKYFALKKMRLLLLFLIVLLVYINLTTLYISFAVFGVLVIIFFLQKLRKKDVYYMDFALLGLFLLLVFSYFTSINVAQGITSTLIPGTDVTQDPAIILEPVNVVPLSGFSKQLVSFSSRLPIFVQPQAEKLIVSLNNYVFFFGLIPLFTNLFYFALIFVLVLIVFFKLRNNFLSYYSFGFFALILILALIGFQQGVHATLSTLNIVFFVCVLLILSKKPAMALIFSFFVLAFFAVPYDFSSSIAENSVVQLTPVIARLDGFDKDVKYFVSVTQSSGELFIQPTDSGKNIAFVSCAEAKPYDFVLNVKGFGKINGYCNYDASLSISNANSFKAVKQVYESEKVKGYSVNIKELINK
ncbi:MAG: hypothetical protein Q7S21_00160 [archaeon]|nr:hypothetical protein [archaeon]